MAVRLARTLALFLLFAAVFGAGCGGGGGDSNPPPGPPPPSFSSVRLNIGDAPVDSIVAFEITINSVTLTRSSGGTVTALSTPTRVELTHLSGVLEPLRILNLEQGSYTSATITVSNPEVKVIDAGSGLPVELNSTLASSTATVNFNPAITIGATPTSLNFDFNLAASVVISGNSATITPTFSAGALPIAAQNDQDDDTGEIEDIVGSVTGVSGSSFTIAVTQTAQTLTFTTNANTEFDLPLTGVVSLTVGLIVDVDAVSLADGSLLATEVETEVEDNDALEIEGLVTGITGAPPTSFRVVVQDLAAPGATVPALGATVNVNLDASTNFKVDDEDVDLNNLTFSTLFINTTLAVAQKVEVDADTPATDNLLADKVKLSEQTLRGTVSNLASAGGQSTFTLTAAADSAFARLTGQTIFRLCASPALG